MKTHELIKKRRKELGLTQDYMAEKLGITKTNVSRMERGHASISVDRLIEVAKILRIQPSMLLSDMDWSPSEISREDAGVISLYTQLNSVEKKQILQLMQLTVKKRKTREALLAGKTEDDE